MNFEIRSAAFFGLAIWALGAAAMAQNPVVTDKDAVRSAEVKKALADPALVDAGKKSFAKCQACHMVGDNAQRRVGPPLNGIVGHAAGSAEGFPYSPGMRKAKGEGLFWTVEKLDGFLKTPREIVPGTIMAFPGVSSEDERKALIAYLASYQPDGSVSTEPPK
ncbi:MAG: c-type cytochrome [Amphiplicatus sp.]|nr:c-type cytochrome [Amphiplicatus sp.]